MFQYHLFQNAEAIDVSTGNQTLSRVGYIYVGTAGNVKVDTLGGQTGITFAMQNGETLPVLVSKIYQTGTTASNMVALS